MPTYRVLGEKPMLYWVELEAKDSHEAYDLADKLTTDKWNLIEEDNTIEPVEVYLNDEEEQDVPLIEDEEDFVFDQVNVIGGE